jgi:hypothetical protein
MSKSIEAVEQEFYNHFLKMDKNSYGLIKIWKYLEEHVFSQTQADEDVIREHLISFLMDIDECYAMHIRENAERCVDEYLAKRLSTQPTPKEEDVEKMAEEILDRQKPDIGDNGLVFSYGQAKRAMIEMYNAAKTTK